MKRFCFDTANLLHLALRCIPVLMILSPSLNADVVDVDIEQRSNILDGRSWGDAGVYEKISGRVMFAFDPDNPANKAITDLQLAPRNEDGKVEAWADLMVLQPKNPASRRDIGWVEVSNRGGKASLSYFNRGEGSLDPVTANHFGDGLLLEQGLTVIWVGWQWDVPVSPEALLNLHVPSAQGPDGALVSGLVRADWAIDAETAVLGLSDRGHQSYSPSDMSAPENVLAVRDSREGERTVIPRQHWQFEAKSAGSEHTSHIRLKGGFKPGRIYELIYRAENPPVVGLGLAAVRDIASHAKFNSESEFPIKHAVAFGVSQTGRFLRHYLYQGFNIDEQNRKVYDGMLIHTAGAGRGSFNHRFGQPSRDAQPYANFFYPTDLYPFTSSAQLDPETGWNEGLLDQVESEFRPKIFYTNSGYEYWGRAASLIHTAPDGKNDVAPLENERIYHLSSAQHFWRPGWPTEERRVQGADAYTLTPLNLLITLRALAVRLVEWVESDTQPPASAYPHLADGTLVTAGGVAFPQIPGITFPRFPHVAYRTDYGPRWAQGIVDNQPPILGDSYPVYVPQVDGFGNEISGVRGLALLAPLATYTPWALRNGAPAGNDRLVSFRGTYIPLPLNNEERVATGDSRPSLAALYGDKAGFIERVILSANFLVSHGSLLERDRQPMIDRQSEHWDWLHARE